MVCKIPARNDVQIMWCQLYILNTPTNTNGKHRISCTVPGRTRNAPLYFKLRQPWISSSAEEGSTQPPARWSTPTGIPSGPCFCVLWVRGSQLQCRRSSEGTCRSPCSSSALFVSYEAVGLFESHEVDCVDSERYVEYLHGEEVKWGPPEDDADIASNIDHQIEFLSSVAKPHNVAVGEDLQEKHDHGDEVQEVPYELKKIH